MTAEILETVKLDRDMDFAKIKKLQKLGILLAIDDVGSEGTYSTNKRVSEYPFDEMKIDQVIIEKFYNPDTIKHGKKLVRSYVNLARSFKIKKITAEYVKNQEVADVLISL